MDEVKTNYEDFKGRIEAGWGRGGDGRAGVGISDELKQVTASLESASVFIFKLIVMHIAGFERHLTRLIQLLCCVFCSFWMFVIVVLLF